MSLISRLLPWAGLLTANVFAGAITYDVSSLPAGMYGAATEERPFRYTYYIDGIWLGENQELDIQFDPALYGGLFNGVAPPGFLVTLLQPDNPPGFPGDYSVFTWSGSQSLVGVFSVDFIFLGTGQPGPQPYYINQYDASFVFEETIVWGMTALNDGTEVPEPPGLPICSLVLLVGGAWWAVGRRSRGAA
jgi:hypothetical protein